MPRFLVPALALGLLLAATARADELIARGGDVIDGRTLTTVGRPAADDLGNVVFASDCQIGSTTSSGIFLRDTGGQLSFVVGTGSMLQASRIRSVANPDLNDAGQIVFEARVDPGNVRAIGLFDLGLGAGQVVIQAGATIAGRTLTRLENPTIDDAGHVVFDNQTELFEIDVATGAAGLLLAQNTIIDGYRIATARRPDLDDTGRVVFTGIGPGPSGAVEVNLFSLLAREAGAGDVIDGVALTSADWGGVADGVGPLFVGQYASSGGTQVGLFSTAASLVLPGDEVAGETIVQVLSVRPSATGDAVFHAIVDGGRAVLLVSLQVPNQPPVADAGADVTAPAGAGAVASVTLDGTLSSDPDGDALAFAWSVPAGSGVVFDDPASATPTADFPVGTTVVTLTVEDGRGGSASDEVRVTVVDVTAPYAALLVDPDHLWAPNGAAVPVSVRLTAGDEVTPMASLRVTCEVSCDETAPLVEEVALTYDEVAGVWRGEALLCAERDGNGDGRTYEVVCTVADEAGNLGEARALVQVDHDQRGTNDQRGGHGHAQGRGRR